MILSDLNILKTLNINKLRDKLLRIYNNTWNFSSLLSLFWQLSKILTFLATLHSRQISKPGCLEFVEWWPRYAKNDALAKNLAEVGRVENLPPNRKLFMRSTGQHINWWDWVISSSKHAHSFGHDKHHLSLSMHHHPRHHSYASLWR